MLDNSLSPASPPLVATNTLPLGIGAEVNAGNAGTRWFMGAMDDARVYDRALSAAEIAALAGAPPAHTITATAGAGGSTTRERSSWRR